MCEVSNQESINANSSEEEYCPVCESPMTVNYYAGVNWLECDNQQCSHVIELGE